MSGKEHLSVGKELDTLVLSDDLTMAFVGCGDIAQFHWQGIQSHAPNIQVTAVVDTNPARAEAMAKQTGAEPFTTLEEALEKGEFDAVDIMLPHDLHAESSINAFAAGKHVVLEKPMAINIDDCERILAAANKADTVFMIAEQSQFWPDVQEAATLIKDGAIGDITHARANFFGPLRIDPNDPIPWRFRIEKSGGGICIDGGAHWIRPLRIWLGEIDEVIAVNTGYESKTPTRETRLPKVLVQRKQRQ
jgi:predicted dehydrogenase